MSSNYLVSAIITTKNEKKHIETCLKSIASQAYKNIEIIVVDNNSSDETKLIAKRYTDKVFNFGPERSAQRNLGAKKAKGKYLFFIDADMVLGKNVIKECVEKCEKSGYGAVIIPEKSFGEGFWTDVKAFERSLYEGDAAIEAARFFEKEIFVKSGGYDEKITGPEDWDLPQRVRQICNIGRINSFILHDEGRTSVIKLAKKKYYYGLKVPAYLNNSHPAKLTAQQVVYLLRPAFYKNWKKIGKNPKLASAMMVMLFAEQLAGFAGFAKGIYNQKKKK